MVSNAGLASSAPIEETTLAEWQKNIDVLATGYFLVSRGAFRVLKGQGIGGALVFVASKNALVAGKNAAAYSAAKAAEAHLARCLAEEGGARASASIPSTPTPCCRARNLGLRWRDERADALRDRARRVGGALSPAHRPQVNVLPRTSPTRWLSFASEAAPAKSTGNILNVDGGVAAAFPR